jgi:hypothetical protein
MQYLLKKACEDGGLTYNTKLGTFPDRGFAVSPFLDRQYVSRLLTKEALSIYIQDNRDLLNKEGHCLGLWYDEKGKQWYFDIVCVHQDYYQARCVAVIARQIAVYDLAKQKTIRIDEEQKG